LLYPWELVVLEALTLIQQLPTVNQQRLVQPLRLVEVVAPATSGLHQGLAVAPEVDGEYLRLLLSRRPKPQTPCLSPG
jgi:hypothetical protein